MSSRSSRRCAGLPPDGERQADARLDVPGLALLSPGMAALVYGLAQTGTGHGVTDPRVYGRTGAGRYRGLSSRGEPRRR